MAIESVLGKLMIHMTAHIVVHRLERLWAWLQQYKGKTDIESILRAEACRAHPGLYEYLSFHLNSRPVDIDGSPVKPMSRDLGGRTLDIPVCLLASGDRVILDPLKDLDLKVDKDWDKSEYVDKQRKLNRTINDDVVYTADSIDVRGGRAIITGGLSRYGSSLATQDALEWEFLSQASQFLPSPHATSDFPALLAKLDRRAKAEQVAGNYLLFGRGRFNALAISTLIVHRVPRGGFRIVVGKRSAETAAHADLFHVIPACMFQPELGDVNGEWEVRHAVLKEYGEELFDKKVNPKAQSAKYFYTRWPPVRKLLKALQDGQCKFEITGLVVNLFNLRPEICALLLVDDADWWKAQEDWMETNWEYVSKQDIIKQHGRAQTHFRLDTAEQDYLNFFGSSPAMWVPPGLAAFWLGVDAARRLT